MKKALLVGINNYPGYENDLRGCLNDVTNVQDILVKHFGFDPAGIRTLADSRATKAAIVDSLSSLVAKCSAGDVLVFHYSGHGSQVRDLDGDELDDGKDEILCPYDFNWKNGFVADDDLAAILKGLPKGVHLEVLLDSCHSGTGTREIVLDRGRLAELGAAVGAGLADQAFKLVWGSAGCLRHKFLTPPPDVALRADEVFGPELAVRRVGSLGKGMNHALWAACRSNQFSADADIGGTPNGAFTYYFCRHVRDSDGKLTRAELLKRIRASLRHEGYSQVPQLEGPESKKKKLPFGAEGEGTAGRGEDR